MARPRKEKIVGYRPDVTYFKPKGVPLNQLIEVDITLDELEALRLSDKEGFSQTEAAARMDVHQSTFQRTLTRARGKIADALLSGKAIKIHGGAYRMQRQDTHPGKHRGTSEMCICPNCGHEEPHQRGNPCNQQICPHCGHKMIKYHD
ncbi:MAG: DUF134 domain-containing protein [Candidatus Woesearchaeota archaeon]